MKIIRQKQLGFLGHVLRTRDVDNLVVTGEKIEKRSASGSLRLLKVSKQFVCIMKR